MKISSGASTLTRSVLLAPRGWLALVALMTSACSVYSNELFEEAPFNVSNGGGGGGGGSVDVSGSSGSVDQSGSGGKGREPPSAGSGAGSGAVGGASGRGDGGAGGMGGSSGCMAVTGGAGGGAPTTVDLIDDCEDKNIIIEQASGRSGVWYLFADGTGGTLAPNPLTTTALTDAPEALGLYGLHVSATGWTSTGSGLGFDFRDGKKVYDASQFTGLRFWARVGAGKNTKHRVQISDVTTDEAGQRCMTGNVPNNVKCGNHFGAFVRLTTSWAQYELLFAKLAQIDGWGNTACSLDKAQVYGLQITAGADLDVDLWVDQLEFF